MNEAESEIAKVIADAKRKRLKEIAKWLALALAILNPVANHQAASYYLIVHSRPPYLHPPEPFLSQHLGLIWILTLLLGVLSMPRWQGILALVAVPVCAFLWGYGL
jgi:uncharacterized membrane protein